MFRLSFFVLGVFILKLNISEASSDFKANAQSVKVDNVPYHVSLHTTSMGFFCSGSLLTAQAILTAASCTLYTIITGDKNESVTARSGSNFLQKGGAVQTVDKMHDHPNFGGFGSFCDVSIWILKAPFKLSKSVNPIQLALEPLKDGGFASVTFWGSVNVGKAHGPEIYPDINDIGEVFSGPLLIKKRPRFDTLKVIKVSKMNYKLCTTRFVTATEISDNFTSCYVYPEGKIDNWQGDFGSPVIVDNKQIGILYWPLLCTKTQCVAIYVNIFYKTIQEFIKKFIK